MTLARRSGELERTYFDVFDRFARMIADGTFPFDVDEVEMESAPRVGDGVIVIDAETRVKFASPNAVSSLHRMGIHAYAQSQRLIDVGFDDTAARSAMLAAPPGRRGDRARRRVGARCGCCRCSSQKQPAGALVLLRDVSDLRRRDRMLLSKDATIREIHHRVKNNLQTIASLLRLQGRRLQSPEARAALAESERRIRSIAIVHETLSREAGDVVSLQRDRAAARPPRRGHRVVAGAHDPLQGRGRRGRAAGRGRDPARGRAERADAERGRPRVPRRIAGRRRSSRCSSRRDRRLTSRSRCATTAPACPRSSRSRAVTRPRPLDRAGARHGELQGSIEMHERRRHVGARARPGRDAAGRAAEPLERSRRGSSADAWSRRPALAEPAALVLGRAAPDAGFLVRRQRELEALARARGTRSHTCFAASIWSSARPVVPIGKNSSGLVSRHDGAVAPRPRRPSRGFESRSAPLRFPLLMGRTDAGLVRPLTCVSGLRCPEPRSENRQGNGVVHLRGKGSDQVFTRQKWNVFRLSGARNLHRMPIATARTRPSRRVASPGRTPSPPSRRPGNWVPTGSSSTCAAPPTASWSSITTPPSNRLGLLVEHPFAAIRAALPWLPTLAEALDACAGMARQRRDEVLAVGARRRPGERGRHARPSTSCGRGAARRRVRLLVRPRDRRRGARRTRRTCRPGSSCSGSDLATAAAVARSHGHRGCTPTARRCSRRRKSTLGHARLNDLHVDVWTVDDPDEMQVLAAAGVDAIITNVPDVAARKRRSVRATRR